MTVGRQTSDARNSDDGIRTAKQLLRRIESNPASAAAITGMDRWERWLVGHGMAAILSAGFDEWDIAVLRCIVRHSGERERIPQAWLFEGGPDGDPILRQFSCLNENARKTRLSRFLEKARKARLDSGLEWKVERAADCSKTIYTATPTVIRGPASGEQKHR
jgi:hypothetical protein